MTRAEFEKWAQDHGTERRQHYANRIDYEFVTMRDGWIAIFERCGGDYTPLIQAADLAHAESYCYLREPVTVPLQTLCEEVTPC